MKARVKKDTDYYIWRSIRDEIFRRDRWTCLRCDKKFIYKSRISVHHLIPRSQGGSDDYENLVTLCNPCHDYVEINGLKSKPEIMGSCEDKITAKKVIPDEQRPESEIDRNRPNWHKYVYGGCKR